MSANTVAQIDSTALYRYDQFSYQPKKVRNLLVGTALVYGASMYGLNQAWYAGYPKTAFHFHNDNDQWLQVDKIGHTYSAYTESLLYYRSLERTGMNRKKAIWIGGGFGFFAQTVIEVLDGFSAEWGASTGDLIANTAGSALLIGQELIWKEQKVLMKWSFHPVLYPAGQLRDRAHNLYGSQWYVSFLKDYNGQSYWLSASIKSFFKNINLPNWLCLSAGYSAEQMYGGQDNTWEENGFQIDRNDIPRLRQYLLSLDVDFTRIKTQKRFLKKVLIVLNVIKIPAPTIELRSNGRIKTHLLYF